MSLNETRVRGDGPLEGLALSGLDGHPLHSRVDQLFRQYRTIFVGRGDFSRISAYRRVAWAHMEELQQHLRQLLAKDIIDTPKLPFILQPSGAHPQEVG